MTYASLLTDKQAIEGMLRPQPGIHSIKVALLAERGVVEFDPKVWTTEKIIEVSGHCPSPNAPDLNSRDS